MVKMDPSGNFSDRRFISIKLSNFQHARSLEKPYFDDTILVGKTNFPKFPSVEHWNYGSVFLKAPEVNLLNLMDFVSSTFDWKAADIWAVGIVLANLIRGGESLFSSNSYKLQYKKDNILNDEELRFKVTNNLLDNFSDHMNQIFSITECIPSQEFITENNLNENYPIKFHKPTETIKLKNKLMSKPMLVSKKQGVLEIVGDNNYGVDDFISKMLNFNPKQRLTSIQLLKHDFFNNFKLHGPIEWNPTQQYPFSDYSLLQFVSDCGGPL